MSYVDSKAIFRQRCLAVGLPTEVVDRLDLRGWSTFANFAHAPTATPGTAGAEVAIKAVLDAILGDSLAAHEAALRRLHWEAWTLTAADLKRKVDGTDEAGPRKLPVAEIGARLQVLAPKISPLKLQGILEPSHASINLFAAMLILMDKSLFFNPDLLGKSSLEFFPNKSSPVLH